MAEKNRYRLRKFVDGVEMEVTDLDRFENDLLWCDPDNPIERTTPVSEADAEAHLSARVGAFAVFPKTAKSELGWERDSLAMHSRQTPVVLEPKPIENQMTRVVRGD